MVSHVLAAWLLTLPSFCQCWLKRSQKIERPIILLGHLLWILCGNCSLAASVISSKWSAAAVSLCPSISINHSPDWLKGTGTLVEAAAGFLWVDVSPWIACVEESVSVTGRLKRVFSWCHGVARGFAYADAGCWGSKAVTQERLWHKRERWEVECDFQMEELEGCGGTSLHQVVPGQGGVDRCICSVRCCVQWLWCGCTSRLSLRSAPLCQAAPPLFSTFSGVGVSIIKLILENSCFLAM